MLWAQKLKAGKAIKQAKEEQQKAEDRAEDVCTDIRIDVCTDMRIDVCTDMCIVLRIDLCQPSAPWHCWKACRRGF